MTPSRRISKRCARKFKRSPLRSNRADYTIRAGETPPFLYPNQGSFNMYRLKTNGKHSYSERELAIFNLLNGHHRLSTGDMVAAMYRGQEPPLNARSEEH